MRTVPVGHTNIKRSLFYSRSHLRPNTALCGRENVAFIARVYGAGLGPTIRFVEEFAELREYFRYYGANPCDKIIAEV